MIETLDTRQNTLFILADEVAKDLQVSKPTAYKIIREMNEELQQMGYLTISGRVSRDFYEEKIYKKR